MKKVFIPIIAAAVILAGCEKDPAEETEQLSETEITAALVSETTTAASTAKAVEEASAETEAEKIEEEIEEIKVTPANEVYDVYPVKLIYPEKQSSGITAKKAEAEDSVTKDGYTMSECSACYPVFSTDNSVFGEAAVKKINDNIKDFINGIIEEERKSGEEHNSPKGNEVEETTLIVYGSYMQRSVTAGGYLEYSDDCYDINGNILSVYFIDHAYSAGAAHGHETPVSLVFDLRTGERVDFNDIIEDKAGFATAVHRAIYMYLNRNSVTDFEKYFQQNWIESGEELGEQYVQSDEDRMDFYNGRVFLDYNDADSRLISANGCVGYYLAPYEYGSYADGIRLIEIPAGDIMQYLNEKGRSLFEGYVSAESEPINVIEYKGKRYFDTIPVLTIEVDIHERGKTYPDGSVEIIDYEYYWRRGEFPPKMLEITDGDYEFFGVFPNVICIEFHGCSNIDFEKLAKIKNIENIFAIELEYCEFGDISPLTETNINYISGTGGIIPFEQAEAFRSREGNYISYDMIGPEYTEYKGHTFALTGNGIEISDRELDEIDYEFIAAQEEIWRLDIVRCTLDYERLAELGNFKYLALKECENIDFAAIAKIDCIDSIRLDHCVFDDISPLYGSGITRIDGEGERGAGQRVSNMQMQEFQNSGGFRIDSYLVE